MAWKVEFSSSGKREFLALDADVRKSAEAVLLELEASGPALVTSLKMRGIPDTWRVRFHRGRYRMIYEATRSLRLIVIKRVRLRDSAYKGSI